MMSAQGYTTEEIADRMNFTSLSYFSRYFGEAAYHYMVEGRAEGYNFVGKPNPVPENKQLLIIPGASHCDLYDGGERDRSGANDNKEGDYIPWDKLEEFFKTSL